MIHQPPPVRPRDFDREAQIMRLAVEAVDRLDDAGLSAYADARAHPYGGVRTGGDRRKDALEEAGDLRNYLVWDTEDHWDAYQAGEPDACDRVVENLSSLADLIRVWARLTRR